MYTYIYIYILLANLDPEIRNGLDVCVLKAVALAKFRLMNSIMNKVGRDLNWVP